MQDAIILDSSIWHIPEFVRIKATGKLFYVVSYFWDRKLILYKKTMHFCSLETLLFIVSTSEGQKGKLN